MLGHRPLNMNDYMGILRRRGSFIVVSTLVVGVAAFLILLKIPNRFTSTTLVLIEQPQVPTSIVQPVETAGLEERLASMKEEILSRARLEPIVTQFGLFAGTSFPMDEKIAELQKRIDVKPVEMMAETRANGLPGFHVIVTLNDARLAQLVCNQVTSMFTDENIRNREQQAVSTSDFIDQTLAQAKKKLDDQDAKLAEFKQRHINDMPDEQQNNMNLLLSLNTQLDGVTQALSRAQQVKSFTESQISQLVNVAKNAQKGNLTVNPNSLDQQLEKAQEDLTSLQSRYTDQYPDVIKKKSEIETLKKQIAAANEDGADADSAIGGRSARGGAFSNSTAATKIDKAGSSPSTVSSGDISVSAAVSQMPQYQSLRTELFSAEQTIREKTKQQDNLLAQIKSYQSRVQMSPAVEEEFKALTRDHGDALAFYDSLLKKHDDATMATDLEHRQQGELFKILDSASFPDKPSFPPRPLIMAGGLAAGFALGVAITLFLEFRDKSLRSDLDVAMFLKIPTLALVPMLESDNAEITRRSLSSGPQNPRLPASA